MTDNSGQIMNRFPEHDRLAKIKDYSQAIGDFVDWLRDTKGFGIYHLRNDELFTAPGTVTDWLAEYFEIDQDKLEKEKQVMLEELRDRGLISRNPSEGP